MGSKIMTFASSLESLLNKEQRRIPSPASTHRLSHRKTTTNSVIAVPHSGVMAFSGTFARFPSIIVNTSSGTPLLVQNNHAMRQRKLRFTRQAARQEIQLSSITTAERWFDLRYHHFHFFQGGFPFGSSLHLFLDRCFSGVAYLEILETLACSFAALSIRNSGDDQEDQERRTEKLHIVRMRLTSDSERPGFSYIPSKTDCDHPRDPRRPLFKACSRFQRDECI